MTTPPPDPAYGYPHPPVEPPTGWKPPSASHRFPAAALIAAAACIGLIAGFLGFGLGRATAPAARPAAAPTAPSTAPAPTQTPEEPATEITPGPTASAPAITPSAPAPAPSPTEAKCEFATLTDREFKLMAKDSSSHFDKCYRIYGYVTQADTATGTLTVRANT
ncbi:hypothetical protein ACIQWN_38270 [Streptomyces vinaceus]|uniref:hypothetical protein n=1 Tax=Streptomyces vinaceus TaxID=1960 RepID=UPI0038177DF4